MGYPANVFSDWSHPPPLPRFTMTAHAKLAPSAAGTWMTCPGSWPLKDKLKIKGTTSIFATNGTAMHEVCEKSLSSKGKIRPKDFLGKTVKADGLDIEITQDFVDICDTFVDYVEAIDGFQVYETRVFIRENCWGTADVISIKGDHMRVIDLKTGMGVKVDGKQNLQLKTYGLGALMAFQEVFDIRKVTCTIVQPPLDNIDSDTYEVEELWEHAEDIENAIERMHTHPDEFVPSEKACAFCAVKAWCPAQHDIANRAAVADFKQFKRSDLSEWMELLPLLKGFIKAVENETKDQLLSGHSVKNFKLVEGRRTRVWENPDALLRKLMKEFPKQDFFLTNRELLSPAQMEKAMKDLAFDLSSHIGHDPGNPTVVSEDDPRDAWDRNEAAKKDFAQTKEED